MVNPIEFVLFVFWYSNCYCIFIAQQACSVPLYTASQLYFPNIFVSYLFICVLVRSVLTNEQSTESGLHWVR
jgi:hypothetical protein